MASKTKNPAARVIKLFGGVRKLAGLLGVSPSTVCRWAKPRTAGGTGGLIPSREQGRILQLARSNKIDISADDILGV